MTELSAANIACCSPKRAWICSYSSCFHVSSLLLRPTSAIVRHSASHNNCAAMGAWPFGMVIVTPSSLFFKEWFLSCLVRKGASGSHVRGAARNQFVKSIRPLSLKGCAQARGCGHAVRQKFHPAVFSYWGGMNARSGVAPPPRTTGYALGYFAAEHHGTAEHQNRAGIRTRRILKVDTRLRSTITGARAGARGGFSRHRQPFRRCAAHG
ncbi:hypothetical protein PhaeoP48_02926 [Phaeobacter inhibens]|nr:hypothetical protein PhaeoP48_02926 [Phaeobacter inhibens]